MRKTILLFVSFLVLSIKPAVASENWKLLPANACPSSPVVSACNLAYVMEANVSTLGSLVSGANNAVARGIGFLYQVPPVSGRDYLSYMGNRLHFPGAPTPTYAATGGVGFTSLAPVLKIWTAMRNLAYFAFAVVFVVIGIMILTRSKIDPKTTVTIQNALPKIILALVLVTFSYAIAGFIIDLMYVSLNLILLVIDALGDQSFSGEIRGQLAGQTLLHFVLNGRMGGVITSGAAAVGNVVDSLIGGSIPVVGNILGLVTSGIAALVIAIAVLWALFKTWFMLLSAYANIILGIIFAPLQLMIDAIPGQDQFSGWIKNMLAYTLSFPAVLVMIFLGSALGTNGGLGILETDVKAGFVPPFIGGNSQVAIQSLIGIAIILTIPKTVEMLQAALKTPENKFGNAWGEAMGAGARPVISGAQRGAGAAWGATYGTATESVRLQEQGWQKARSDRLASGNTSTTGLQRPHWIKRKLSGI